MRVSFTLAGQSLGAIDVRAGNGLPGNKFLRDRFLDECWPGFIRRELARRLGSLLAVESFPDGEAADHPRPLVLKQVKFRGRFLFHKIEEPERVVHPLDGLTLRQLARLALIACEGPPGGEPPPDGDDSPAASRPVLVVWQFGRAEFDPGENAARFDQVIVFQSGRRDLPCYPEVSRDGRTTRVRARDFSMRDVARVVSDLAGSRPVWFTAGLPAGCYRDLADNPPPLAGRDGIRFVFPGFQNSPAGSGDTPAGPVTENGFTLPADVFVKWLPLGEFAARRIVCFYSEGRDLLPYLPARPRRFHTPDGLRHALYAFFSRAAVDGAGFGTCRPGRLSALKSSPFGAAWRRLRAFFWGLAALDQVLVPVPDWTIGGLARRLRSWVRNFRGKGRVGFWRESLLLTGFVLGLGLKIFRKRDQPELVLPAGAIGEAGVDLRNGSIRWEKKADGPETFLFATAQIGDRPCGCLGFPVYAGSRDAIDLPRRVREEFLSVFDARFLRQLAQLWFDELAAGASPEAGADPRSFTAEAIGPERLELVLATRDRTDDLVNLLDSLRTLRQPISVRIVDSAPTGPDTADLCRSRAIPYLRCPFPGKSRALNLGIRESRADIILFTDDDAITHPEWATRLLGGFYRPGVMGVNGLVLPWRVDNTAQYLFETHMEEYEMGGLRRGFVEREFALPGSPYRAAHFGTGVNMAMRRRVFEEIGWFDEALSPGTPARAGEEIDMYFRILRAGYAIVYQPEAIVWHAHRATLEKLDRLVFNYGVSSGGFALRWALRERAPLALYYLFRWNVLGLLFHALAIRRCFPLDLLLREVRGGLAGPAYYLVSCWKQARFNAKLERDRRS